MTDQLTVDELTPEQIAALREQLGDDGLDAHPEALAIICTHSYISYNNMLNTQGQVLRPMLQACHNRLLFLGCGHSFAGADGDATLRNKNTNCSALLQACLCNYQGLDNGGNGYLRIVRFKPHAKVAYAQTYSPTLDDYMTGEAEYLMRW